jgi:predicted phosphate transport protein (TIGR00153 family)
MAQSSYFSRIFGNSPVSPLQKHIDKVVLCVEELIPYFDAVMKNDWGQAEKIQSHLAELENDADEIKNLLRMQLPSSLFMPMDRRDVLDVLQLQDKIANKAKDIAGLVLGRKMLLPESICKTYIEFLNRCIDAIRQAQSAINELDELVTVGFRGNEVTRVKKMIEELHIIEGETDKIQIKLRAELFKIEKDLPPVDVMFIYNIIEWTGDLADNAQSTGNRLQLMLAK